MARDARHVATTRHALGCRREQLQTFGGIADFFTARTSVWRRARCSRLAMSRERRLGTLGRDFGPKNSGSGSPSRGYGVCTRSGTGAADKLFASA